MNDEDFSAWIESLRAGNKAAQEDLWNAYFERLVRMASQRLGPVKPIYDEEDAALSAFRSFFAGLKADRFPDIKDQRDLWRLLVVITIRKIQSQQRKRATEKRGGNVAMDSSLSQNGTVSNIMGNSPSPDLAMSFAESCQTMLAELKDETLREIALKRLAGLSNAEIAAELGCARRTVDRKLERIRDIWSERDGQSADSV